MRRRLRVLFAGAGVLTLALVAVPGVVAGDPCYHGYTIPPTTSEATSTVQLDPCAFLPTNAQVEPGTDVTFVNRSGMPHLLMGANAQWGDRDTELAPGSSVVVRFDQPGVYPYSCALHRGMTGSVVVGDPEAAAGASTTDATGTTPGASSQQTLFVAIALAALAVAGWTVAIAQSRRGVTAAT
jgi:plastocyanin